jgi:hypothetical protein
MRQCAIWLSAIAASFILGAPARAESFTLLGEAVHYEVPKGFCALSKYSDQTRLFFEDQRRLTAASSELIDILAPCAELERAELSEKGEFTKWLQLSVLKQHGAVRKIPLARTQFLDAMAKVSGVLDAKAAKKVIDERLATVKPTRKVSGFAPAPAGRDDEAVYLVTSVVSEEAGRKPKEVRAASAITLVRGLPMNITAYQDVKMLPDLSIAPQLLRPLLDSVLKN